MKFAWLAAAVLLASCGGRGERSSPQAEAPQEFFRVDPAEAAEVTGTVHFKGKPPAPKRISMSAEEACEGLNAEPVYDATIQTGKGGGLANVFVYIQSGLQGKNFEPPKKEAVVLDQRGCMFVPRVAALRTGQTLSVRNSDPVSHNIHPMPQNNREWNQHQAPGAPELHRRFVRPEALIPVKCNVHSWMRSFIGVSDHPFFAVTGDDGQFRWESVPPGEYTLAAWHEGFGELTRKLLVKAGAREQVSFQFP